ncbi:MAG: hypothetical protein IPH33_18975 [Bacteroidetes bacterium]|nr:hypothetical protein [Bacteroidota bacterium]
MLAILFTYLVARQFLLDKWYSLLAVAILIAIPDFFSQIHRERSEVMICACLMAGIYFFNKIMKIPDEKEDSISFLYWNYCMASFIFDPSILHCNSRSFRNSLSDKQKERFIYSADVVVWNRTDNRCVILYLYYERNKGICSRSRRRKLFSVSRPTDVCERLEVCDLHSLCIL